MEKAWHHFIGIFGAFFFGQATAIVRFPFHVWQFASSCVSIGVQIVVFL